MRGIAIGKVKTAMRAQNKTRAAERRAAQLLE
jgi:hypothetical protein